MKASHVHSAMGYAGAWAKTRRTFATVEAAMAALPNVHFEGPDYPHWRKTITVYSDRRAITERNLS